MYKETFRPVAALGQTLYFPRSSNLCNFNSNNLKVIGGLRGYERQGVDSGAEASIVRIDPYR